MFTDMKQTLEAEGLALAPLGPSQDTAASQVVARHATDKDDLADLLGALGLPRSEDDLVRLLSLPGPAAAALTARYGRTGPRGGEER